MRILIIDDEAGMVKVLKDSLSPIASLVESVDNLPDAIEMARDGRYNVIIQDIRLAEKPGRPATGKAEALAAIPKFKASSAAVVVVSGLPEDNIKQEVLDAGADAFVAKDGSFSARAMLMATQVATMNLPPGGYKSDSYLSHVELLRNLVEQTT